ncbi:Outer membrane efflux protein [Fuerstiella marisgermanici]|uniref:Outer membrane efflux protein n=1 Tax=Fuerstiella marisgermanici TaxID=1891926 RepID=A0A1P8WAB4_9PLAN|nr:Outer membrane efflux protein [Fuerstiella marisgermanici]
MQTNSTDEFETKCDEFRLDGVRLQRRRICAGLLVASLFAIFFHSLPSGDLSAASEDQNSQATSIRLKLPDFAAANTSETTPTQTSPDQPVPGLQIVRRNGAARNNELVIRPRQESPQGPALYEHTDLETIASLVSQNPEPAAPPEPPPAKTQGQAQTPSPAAADKPSPHPGWRLFPGSTPSTDAASPKATDRFPQSAIPQQNQNQEQADQRRAQANSPVPFSAPQPLSNNNPASTQNRIGQPDSPNTNGPTIQPRRWAPASPNRSSLKVGLLDPQAAPQPPATNAGPDGNTPPPGGPFGLAIPETSELTPQPAPDPGTTPVPAAPVPVTPRSNAPPLAVEPASPAPANSFGPSPHGLGQPPATFQPHNTFPQQNAFQPQQSTQQVPQVQAPGSVPPPPVHGVPLQGGYSLPSGSINGGHGHVGEIHGGEIHGGVMNNGGVPPTVIVDGPAQGQPGAHSHYSSEMQAPAPVGSETIITDSSAGIGQPLGGHSFLGPAPGTSGFRATSERDGLQWMAQYHARADLAGQSDGNPNVIPHLRELPPGFKPWWDFNVSQPTGHAPSSIAVEVGSLLQNALLYSPQVSAIQTEPEVQYRVITQEAAAFDWTAFLETKYDDLNDPVGNTLTTGNGEDRLIVRKARSKGGLRQRNRYGGELQISQQLGHENQNSSFFVPNNQATSRLELSYRQPLLDGAGRSYNESDIVLARIQANSSEDEVVGALQDHLIEVTKAYWALHRARAEFFQRQKLLMAAQNVLARLEGRQQVDTIPRQVLRARAAVARSQTRIQRTVARFKDAEAQLRLLVNSPDMTNGGPVELTPMEAPSIVTETADLRSVLQTALLNRPDISEAIRQMRGAAVRLGVSRQELLPRLDFLVETYVADLAGRSNLGEALRGQYGDNRPGYTVGLEFEFPIENRAARARLEQRQWELKRAVNVFRATVEKLLTDVEIANREVATAYSEMLSRYQSMSAADNESRYLQDRFEVLPASEDSATLLLEDLLDSYERRADEEAAFVQAQVDHAIALVALKKEIGILLQSRHQRPNIQQAEQQWIDNRLDSAFDAANPSRPEDRTQAVVGTAANYGQPVAKASQASQASNPPTSPTYDASGVVRPMPAHPTTWARPVSQTR